MVAPDTREGRMLNRQEVKRRSKGRGRDSKKKKKRKETEDSKADTKGSKTLRASPRILRTDTASWKEEERRKVGGSLTAVPTAGAVHSQQQQ